MRLLPALLPLALVTAALQLVGVTSAVAAPPTPLYAYAAGTRTTGGCPADTANTPAVECSLAGAIAQSFEGDTIALATSGDQAHYVGNWTIDTPGTSATTPVTLTAAPGLAAPPVLDGNHGSATGCTTSACNTSVLSIPDSVTAVLDGLDVVSGRSVGSSHVGGAVDAEGAGLTINRCRFTGNQATAGGAVSSGGTGLLVVTDSAFIDNTASVYGGAIYSYQAPMTVSGSEFVTNLADDGIGGAIYNSVGTLTVNGSTFAGNEATSGGAIASGYRNAGGSPDGAVLVVSDSHFTSNHADYAGGAIDNADGGVGTLTLRRTSIVGSTGPLGGAIDNAGAGGTGTVRVLDSTLSGNTAGVGGGILNGSTATSAPGAGTLLVVGSTLAGDVTDATYGGRTHGRPRSGARAGTTTPSEITSQSADSTVVTAGSLFAGACLVPSTGWTDDGHNAATDASCVNAGAGDLLGAAVGRLQPVTTAGVIALSPTNLAIGLVLHGATAIHAPAGLQALCPRTDQTGHAATVAAACNAGAVDSPAPVRPTLSLSGGHSVAVGSAHSFTGRARPGAAVTLYDGTTRLAATTASSTGTYRFSTEVSRSGRYTTVADHQTSAVLAIRAVKLTLVVSGKRPLTGGPHRLHGAAPAGRVVRLLVDGHAVAHTTATASNRYGFTLRLAGTHTYAIACDGSSTKPLTLTVH